MLRAVSQRLNSVVRTAVLGARAQNPNVQSLRWSSTVQETDEEFDARYLEFFGRKDIDGWELRKGMNDIVRMDLIPEPKIIEAALRACRRLNDYSLTTRFLESIKFRCETNKDLWPYVVQEIKPTLDELGISTPEEMGYDKPELALKSVFDVHG